MSNKCELPQHEIDALVRHFLPQIKAFFESKEGQKEYEAWQQEQDELVGETDKEGGKKKYVKERKNNRKKKQTQEDDDSMQLSM